jgi:arylformamidase
MLNWKKIIDITLPLSSSTMVFPGDPKPIIEKACTLEEEGYVVSRLSLGSHTGTHVDAPSHILKNGPPVDKLELKKLIGTAIVLDFSSSNGELTAEILKTRLKDTLLTGKEKILLLKTRNWGLQSRESMDLQNRDLQAKKRVENFAYLGESGAKLIVEKKFATIGIDNFSIDSLTSENFPAHRILLSNQVNIVECLDLDSVEAGIYFFICLPLKIKDCDGAPARVVLFQE